jgi:hypothetical protein
VKNKAKSNWICCIKVFGFLPGVMFWSETKVSDYLWVPKYWFMIYWITSRPWRWDTQVVPKHWFLTKKWRQVKTKKCLYKTTATEAFNRIGNWMGRALPKCPFTISHKTCPVDYGFILPCATQNSFVSFSIFNTTQQSQWQGLSHGHKTGGHAESLWPRNRNLKRGGHWSGWPSAHTEWTRN